MIMLYLDHVFTSSHGMLIYKAVRSCLLLVSLVMYVCVSRKYMYTYRVRDWVVNAQWMVADVPERTMNQEEAYFEEEMTEESFSLEESNNTRFRHGTLIQ